MAKKSRSRNNSNNNMNQSKDELIERMKAEKIASAIRDDRFEDLVKEYEEFKVEKEKEYEDQLEKLQSEFEAKTKILKAEEEQIEVEKNNIEKLKEEEIKKIQDEQEILAEEYFNELIMKSDEKVAAKKKALEDEIKEYENRSATLRLEHEEHLRIAEEDIKKKYEEHSNLISEELKKLKETVDVAEQKIKDEKALYSKEKRVFERLKGDFDFQKELLDEEKEVIETLKEKYSPKKLVKLQLEYEELKRISEVESERLIEITNSYINLKSRLPGSDSELEVIVAESEKLKKENIDFADRLALYPSIQEVERLRNDAKVADQLKDEIQLEIRRRQEAEITIESINLGVRELEQSKKVARTLRTLNDHLQNEIAEINKMYQASTSAKFQALCEIDKEIEAEGSKKYINSKMSLEELVIYVRNYGATKNDLYYSEKMLQCYFASMASSHMIILQGLSGTGKSSLPRLLKKALGLDFALFPVQPSWRDNRELLGYDNDFTKRFKETEFTKFMYKISAPQNENNINLAVLDEMNLARVEYYFADFLAVLENDESDWIIPLVPAYDEQDQTRIPKYLLNKTSLQIKNNTWFIGTVNRDESTFGITNKVYDRAMVIDFNEREEAFDGTKVDQKSISFNELTKLFSDASKNSKYLLDIGDKARVKRLDDFLKEKMSITFGNRIENQINKYVPVFVAAGGTKEEALDYLFAYKVLRQLEDRYEPYLKKSIKELKDLIKREFGNSFLESMKLLDKKEEQLGG